MLAVSLLQPDAWSSSPIDRAGFTTWWSVIPYRSHTMHARASGSMNRPCSQLRQVDGLKKVRRHPGRVLPLGHVENFLIGAGDLEPETMTGADDAKGVSIGLHGGVQS